MEVVTKVAAVAVGGNSGGGGDPVIMGVGGSVGGEGKGEGVAIVYSVSFWKFWKETKERPLPKIFSCFYFPLFVLNSKQEMVMIPNWV